MKLATIAFGFLCLVTLGFVAVSGRACGNEDDDDQTLQEESELEKELKTDELQFRVKRDCILVREEDRNLLVSTEEPLIADRPTEPPETAGSIDGAGRTRRFVMTADVFQRFKRAAEPRDKDGRRRDRDRSDRRRDRETAADRHHRKHGGGHGTGGHTHRGHEHTRRS